MSISAYIHISISIYLFYLSIVYLSTYLHTYAYTYIYIYIFYKINFYFIKKQMFSDQGECSVYKAHATHAGGSKFDSQGPCPRGAYVVCIYNPHTREVDTSRSLGTH